MLDKLNTLRLIYPLILIVLIVIANFFGVKIVEIVIEDELKLDAIKIILENNVELAQLISTVSVIFLAYIVATRNYSSFIPQKMNVKMYFDPNEAQNYLDKLPKNLKTEYPISSNIDQSLERFWRELSETVELKSEGKAHFSPNKVSEICGDGSVDISITEAEGFQQYYIQSASGSLNLSYPDSEHPIDTLFEIAETPKRNVSVPIANLIRARGFYISPTFHQLYKFPYMKDPESFKKLVVITFISAGTKIRITHSIYLWEENGMYIPIGFGIYTAI